MAQQRTDPYVWVTWITKLLSGDAYCEWAAWFRTHYTYAKRPSDFDLTAWKAQHGEMVRARVALLKSEGYTVYVGDQNKFRLRGETVTLGGSPDIVAIKGNDALVIDCKTGQQRDSDFFQVFVYMLALPLTRHPASNSTLRGEVQYRDRSVPIPPERITPELREGFRSLMRRISASPPAVKVPSYSECRDCDIDVADCPDRVENPPQQEHGSHDLF